MKPLKYILGVILVLGFVGINMPANAQSIPAEFAYGKLACGDLIDNDGDGLTDCDDKDCWRFSQFCSECEDQSLCVGFIPAADDPDKSSCQCQGYFGPTFRCAEGEIQEDGRIGCSDGIDNDNDGIVDCDEFACSCECYGTMCQATVQPRPEDCTTCYDEDIDQYLACMDDDCMDRELCLVEPPIEDEVDEQEARALANDQVDPGWREYARVTTSTMRNKEVLRVLDTKELIPYDPLAYEGQFVRVSGELGDITGPDLRDVVFEKTKAIFTDSTNSFRAREVKLDGDYIRQKCILMESTEKMRISGAENIIDHGAELRSAKEIRAVGDKLEVRGYMRSQAKIEAGARELILDGEVNADGNVKLLAKEKLSLNGRVESRDTLTLDARSNEVKLASDGTEMRAYIESPPKFHALAANKISVFADGHAKLRGIMGSKRIEVQAETVDFERLKVNSDIEAFVVNGVDRTADVGKVDIVIPQIVIPQ